MYQTMDGDTWDLIAKKVYGDENKADFLMSNNMKLLDVFIFGSGILLQTPDLPQEQKGIEPPWR